MNNAQNDREDRYSVLLVVVGVIIIWGLIEIVYRTL